MAENDEELELVLAISKQTFLEEQRRRDAEGSLIQMDAESIQERDRQEKINQIKRLYSHPHSLQALGRSDSIPHPATPLPTAAPFNPHHNMNIGWNPQMGASSAFPPTPQMMYGSGPIPTVAPYSPFVPQMTPLMNHPLFPVPPRVKHTSESMANLPRQNNNWTHPQASSSSLSHIATPSHFPSSSTTSFIMPDIPPPPLPIRTRPASVVPRLPPRPRHDIRLSTVIPLQDEEHPYANELIVPYAAPPVVPPLPDFANGDLLDFSIDPEQWQLFQDFDPLYRPPIGPSASASLLEDLTPSSPTAPASSPSRTKSTVEPPTREIAPRNSSSRISVPERPSSAQEITSKEGAGVSHLYSFHARKPPIVEQLERLVADEMFVPHAASLRFFSSIADYYCTREQVQIIIYKDHTWPSSSSSDQLVTAVDTNLRVEVILQSALVHFLPNEHDVPMDRYAFKVFGLNEIMPNNSIFGKNLYVGECLLLGKDIALHLGRIDDDRRNSADHTSYGQLTEQVQATSVIDEEDVQKMAELLNVEMLEYEKAVKEHSELAASHHATKIKQFVKMLCQVCGGIEPIPVHTRLQAYTGCTIASKLGPARNDLVSALHSLVYVFCCSSMSRYSIAPIRKVPTTIKPVAESTDRVHLIVNSLHNLPNEWVTGGWEFEVVVHLFHGTHRLGSATMHATRTVLDDAFYPYIQLQLYASFETQRCTLPREARFVFVLIGSTPATNNNDVTVRSVGHHLATTSISLFDHERFLRQGQFFLPMKLIMNNMLETWGGMPIIGSGREPVLIVTVPFSDDCRILFPEIASDEIVRRAESREYDIAQLPPAEQEALLYNIEIGSIEKMEPEDKELMWQRRHYLTSIPDALPLVLASIQDWSIAFLPSIYEILESWTNVPPIVAIQLLLPRFPDERVRAKAIEWIDEASKENSDFIFSFLPQLVEALRFEPNEDSALARFLVRLAQRDSKFAFRIYWQLQQRIDHFYDNNFSFAQRCSLLQKVLLEGHAKTGLGAQIVRQRWLLSELDAIQMKTRDMEGSERQLVLQTMLSAVNKQLQKDPVALPLVPSFTCTGINVKECFIFNSNAKPHHLSFKGTSAKYDVIHKIGDDMRQDALVLQLVSLMNDIWRSDGLDLRMVIFNCMTVGFRKGMAQMVPDCATLAAIQKQQGVFKGVFQDDVLNKWLMKHNDSEFVFNQALDNFRRSCAGWCVATYLLGIGDRHNDNILVTAKGHVFHIDFGKYMGDWQMAGAIKRDRVPFVFTPEMYFVVNQSQKKQTEHYQQFIDLCTQAFNSLRAKSPILLNLLNLMACSNIPGMNLDSHKFVEDNLMLQVTPNEATVQFTQMIQQSLQSSFPRLNFAIHNIAQHFSSLSTASNDDDRLKFMPAVYTAATDGRIVNVCVLDIHKVKIPNKVYMYGMEVRRENDAVPSKVYRSYSEIYEFYIKMFRKFPTVPFPPLSREAQFRSNVAAVARRRLTEVKQFIFSLLDLADEVKHCDLVYTFFHSRLGDNQDDPSSGMAVDSNELGEQPTDRSCQLHLKFGYIEQKKQLTILIGHAKGLVESPPGYQPDTYIKTYLRPDMQKLTKAKTPIVRASCNPTYNHELKYKVDSNKQLEQRVLEISVWYASSLRDNSAQYNYWYALKKLADVEPDRRGNRMVEGWFELPRAAGPSDYSHG